MMKNVVVVDDFYTRPDEVRALALRDGDWHYLNNLGTRRQAPETRKCYYNPKLVARFEALLGMSIHVDPRRMSFGVFAYDPEGGHVEHTTHFDDTEWAGIIYLVPPEHCRGGISFYRHKATGLLGRPTPEQLRALGFASMEQYLEQGYYPDKLRPEAWERVGQIGMRFNRLVLLRGGHLFHRADSEFGHGPADGRLTQRFFFESKAGA